MEYEELLWDTSDHARRFFSKHTTPAFVYHNKKHTESVLKNAELIMQNYHLNERDTFIVKAAIWFHDLGYMKNLEHHEASSAELAADFFIKKGAQPADVRDIRGCILATRVPQEPATLLEQIVCDADLYHLSTEDFFKADKLLRKEFAKLKGRKIAKPDWHRGTISFMEAHRYHTEFAKIELEPGKQQNLKFIRSELLVSAKPKTRVITKRPTRGIETMFKMSSSNHQRLSNMADNKAHILIAVNSIILSAIISLVLRRLGEYHFLILPTFVLLGISLGAMILAILSTRPALSTGRFNHEDVDNKRVNLIFFGNFYKMSFEEYAAGMDTMMADHAFLYGTLTRDIYNQGVVLGHKYHLLRMAYNIFMYGLIVSVITFTIASIFFIH